MFAMSQPHVDSFNDLIEGFGSQTLAHADVRMQPPSLGADPQLTIRVTDLRIGYPVQSDMTSIPSKRKGVKLLPRQCRESGLTYAGPLRMNFEFQSERGTISVTRTIGDMPIMVLSERCVLSKIPLRILEGVISRLCTKNS